MANPPVTIRAIKEDFRLELQWDAGPLFSIPFKFVRSQCPCAACIDEFTGRRVLEPESIPEDILPTQMSFIGNYALKIVWSDGHSTGLYTWDHLAAIAEQYSNPRVQDV